MRESPTFLLLDKLRNFGAEVAYYDPHVPVIGPTREHMDWAGTLASFDVIVIATHHRAYDLEGLAESAALIVDTRNAMRGVATRPGQVVKA